MADFPTDGEIVAATQALADAFAGPQGSGFPVGPPVPGQPLATSGAPAPFGGLTVTGVTRDSMVGALDPVLAVDPARCRGEGDRLARALAPIESPAAPGSEGFVAACAAASRRLEGWQGEGADAFRRQLERMTTFAESQTKALVRVAALALGAFQVAVLARRDVLALTAAATTALGAVAAQEADQGTRALLYLGGGVAAGVVGAITTPGLLLATLTAGASTITTATTVAATELSGATADDVARQYVAARDRVLRTLDDEMHYLQAQGGAVSAEYRGDPALAEPLPGSTDVHSPAFRYLDMASEWQSSPAFGDAVRRAATPPTPGPPSAIRRALG